MAAKKKPKKRDKATLPVTISYDVLEACHSALQARINDLDDDEKALVFQLARMLDEIDEEFGE